MSDTLPEKEVVVVTCPFSEQAHDPNERCVHCQIACPKCGRQLFSRYRSDTEPTVHAGENEFCRDGDRIAFALENIGTQLERIGDILQRMH